MNQFIILLVMVNALLACGSKRNPFFTSVLKLNVNNQTSRGLIINISEAYPDTSIPLNNSKMFGVPPGSKTGKVFKGKKWSDVFARTPKDTLSVFLFSSDTVVVYSWDEIRSGYKVLKRFDLSQQDLEAMNYTVTYP